MAGEAEGRRRSTARGSPSERPRDELGRPLARGATNRLVLEDFDSRSREENHRLGRTHFNAGRYFPAHKAWEAAWKRSRGTDDAEFFKGLSQLGAGYVHVLRGNARGAKVLLERARRRISRYPKGHHRVDTQAVAERCGADIEAIEEGRLVPGARAMDGKLPSV